MSDTMIDDSFQVVNEKFLEWLQRRGAAVSNKIAIHDYRADHQAGRGVIALQNIEEDEELFTIPRHAILTAETSTIPTASLEGIDDPWLQLILAMVYEYQQGSDSPWKAYFDILPATFDTLMFWSPAELDHLQGSAVVDKISKSGADQTFTQRLIPIIRSHAEFRSQDSSNDDLLALCHRMGSTIMAYAFDLENATAQQSKNEEDGWEEDDEDNEIQTKGMVPLADLLNADADRNNAKLFYEENKVVMKTVKPIQAGEEIFNDYGSLPTADVLRRYGYVTENYAKYDVVEISAVLIKENGLEHLSPAITATELGERWDYLEEQGILDDGYDILRTGGEDAPIPDELSIVLNTLTASKDDFATWKRKDKLPKPEITPQSQQLLRQILVQRYAMYQRPASPQRMDGNSISAHRQNMAAQVIRGEERVLQEVYDSLSTSTATSGKRKADLTLDEEAHALQKRAKR